MGTGDVGTRCAVMLASCCRVIAMVRRPERRDEIAAQLRASTQPTDRARSAIGSVRFVVADLDQPASLRRIAGLATRIVQLAPPPASGDDDPRTRALVTALGAARARSRTAPWSAPGRRLRAALAPGATLRSRAGQPAAMVARGSPGAGAFPLRLAYVSTTGVYGDRHGDWVDEASPPRPESARAQRRVAAERRLREATRRGTAQATVLRAPGIYAEDRLPFERLRRGLPALVPEEDVFTNHIHADDLARSAWYALMRGRPGRVYNVVDDTELRMGDYFDLIADHSGLPRAPRVTRAQLVDAVSPMMLSFMSESRRVRNDRLLRELRMPLRYPSVRSFLDCPPTSAAKPPQERAGT